MFIEIEKLTKSKNTPWKTHHPQNTKKGDVIALCLSYKTHHRCLSKNCLFLSSTFLQIKAFCVVSWVLAALCQVNQSLVILFSTPLRTIKSHCTEGLRALPSLWLHFTILSPAFSPPFLTPTELSRVETLWCEIIVSVTLNKDSLHYITIKENHLQAGSSNHPGNAIFSLKHQGHVRWQRNSFNHVLLLTVGLGSYCTISYCLFCFALLWYLAPQNHIIMDVCVTLQK